MSRHQTVINDFEESGQAQQNKLTYIEFLEFFARVAYIRFFDSEMENLSLSEKLAHLMDEVFRECLQTQRNTGVADSDVDKNAMNDDAADSSDESEPDNDY
jgi:CRISPR/Cas system Type II protein with McrA/HNH and RuvC-like nuclease domain